MDLNNIDSCLAAAMGEAELTASEAWKKLHPEEPVPTVIEQFDHPDNDATIRFVEGAKFIEHDPTTEDGKAYLLSLLEGNEEWNSHLQTLNLGSVVCMVKNNIYDELMKNYPDVELDDSYFRLYKAHNNA